MTQSPASGEVPQWTVGDRLDKALAHAGIGVGEMATYLGLSRNSVSAYINDRQEPKRQTILLWAMRTGVSLEWLEHGRGDSTPPDGPDGVDTPALAKLTEQKRSRARRSSTTRDYFQRPVVPAVAA